MSELVIERTFDAEPEKVFAFVTQSEHLLKWWGPVGVTVSDHHLDFSRAGRWSATMHSQGGAGHKVGGEVIDVDPPRSVEFTLGHYYQADARSDESTIRFELHPIPSGRTHFVLTQTGLKPEHIADVRDKGWSSALQRLDDLITTN